MKITLPLHSDSANTYLYEATGLEIYEGDTQMVITLDNPRRQVEVSKSEFLRACAFFLAGANFPGGTLPQGGG